MRIPSFDQIQQLVKGIDPYMWGDESLHNSDNPDFPYYYNYQGNTLYNFQSLQHLILFFFGDDKEQAEAEKYCMIEEITERDHVDDEEEYKVTQNPPMIKIYVAWGKAEATKTDEYGMNKKTAQVYEFFTSSAAHAFLQGAEESEGWQDYSTLIQTPADEAQQDIFHSSELASSLEKIIGYDSINIDADKIENEDIYTIEINDQSFFYYNEEERNADLKTLYESDTIQLLISKEAEG